MNAANRRLALPASTLLLAWALTGPPAGLRAALQSDLDEFMARVLERRDENWKKVQQYVLDERETVELLAPGRVRLYGRVREFTWFMREDVFVRSPVRFDGVTLGEDDRRTYEQRWIERERNRDPEGVDAPPTPSAADVPTDLQDVLSPMREPRFVSAAYFLKFKFEPGHYALVGRETFDSRPVYRIEYYPEHLFSAAAERIDRRRASAQQEDDDLSDDDSLRLERQMNKVALVTLWVEPAAHQILKYTFDNVGFDFLPGRWLVRMDDAYAQMTLGEAFPGVWLPRDIDAHVVLTLAKGTYELLFDVDYLNYREAVVKAEVR